MGRRPTKAADNPFCRARLEAAKYNEKFFSKEYAAEQLHISACQLQDYELGITKCIPPDNILRRASDQLLLPEYDSDEALDRAEAMLRYYKAEYEKLHQKKEDNEKTTNSIED